MAKKEQTPGETPIDTGSVSRHDPTRCMTNDQQVELRAMAKLNEQTQELRKSINVFTTTTTVKNPFLQANQVAQSQKQGNQNGPAAPSPSNGSKSER